MAQLSPQLSEECCSMPACHSTQKQQAAASPRTPADTAAALSVALQHPILSSAPRNICSMLQVCKSWRTAVQQSTAAQTCIDVSVDRGPPGWEKLAAFAMWLPKHAGLAGSIAIEAQWISQGVRATDHIAASLVGLSFQQVATGSQSAAPWALRSFTGHGLVSPNSLSALPVAHLTALDIELPGERQQPCFAAVGCLTNLRTLRIHLGSCKSDSPGFLQHLSALSKLTMLSLGDISSRSDFTTLPQSLQIVKLILDKSAAVDLALERLTCLKQLALRCLQQPATPQELPSQLQVLEAATGSYSAIHSFRIGALQQLQRLRLHYSRDSADDYKQLARHLQLEHVELRWPDLMQLAEAAAVWGTIPKLASFKVSECLLRQPASRLQTLARHLSAATSLTKLDLSFSVYNGQDADVQGRSVCELLTSLTNLKSLKTWGGASTHWTAASGIQHFTALTALTKLDVTGGLPAVDETNAILLALKLTNLEVLALGVDSCNSGWSTAPLPVIGQLARLRHLSLGELVEENAKRGLSCLVALNKLTHLHGFKAAGSDALAEFWAALRSE